MSNYWGNITARTPTAQTDVLNVAPTSNAFFRDGNVIHVWRLTFVVSVTIAGGDAILTVRRADEGGGNLVDIGTITIPEGSAVGGVFYTDLGQRQLGQVANPSGTVVNANDWPHIEIQPGQQLQIHSGASAASSGQVRINVHFTERTLNAADAATELPFELL